MKESMSLLMHKDDPVMAFSFDSRGYIEKIENVLDAEKLPVFYDENEDSLKLSIQRWLLRRTSGRNRTDYIPLRSFYGDSFFVSKNKVSLYDTYWVKSASEDDLKWSDVSPFKNFDPEDDEYFGVVNDPENTYRLSGTSPNLTLPGNDHRFWYKDEGYLGIINESSQKEMKAYKMSKQVGADEIFYARKYIILCSTIYSFHPVDTSEDVESISFEYYYDKYQDPSRSKMENLEEVCRKLGISDWKKFFYLVKKYDDAIEYSDRELSEFRVLRNTETLEPISFEKL